MGIRIGRRRMKIGIPALDVSHLEEAQFTNFGTFSGVTSAALPSVFNGNGGLKFVVVRGGKR
jgi:hypothetical protein